MGIYACMDKSKGYLRHVATQIRPIFFPKFYSNRQSINNSPSDLIIIGKLVSFETHFRNQSTVETRSHFYDLRRMCSQGIVRRNTSISSITRNYHPLRKRKNLISFCRAKIWPWNIIF